MITSKEYKTQALSKRSRLISSIYKTDWTEFCINYYFNINGNSSDGFKVFLENYLDNTETVELRKNFGPLGEDRWHLDRIQITELKYELFRVGHLEKVNSTAKKILIYILIFR